jgi:hypothetical protein
VREVETNAEESQSRMQIRKVFAESPKLLQHNLAKRKKKEK